MIFLSACDKACKDSCSGAGPDMCDECATGYELSEEEQDTCKGQQLATNLSGVSLGQSKLWSLKSIKDYTLPAKFSKI